MLVKMASIKVLSTFFLLSGVEKKIS